jgi:hypothetical protein
MRRLSEGVLIVLSILLAFGIEAGWSQRGERVAEVEALRGLQSDFSENAERLRATMASHVVIRDSGVRLLAMTGPDATASASDLTLDTLVMNLIGGPKVFPVTATYDALIASGRIDLLQSAELRRELAQWTAIMTDLGEIEREARAQMDQRLLPFVWDYVPIVTLDLNVLPSYEDSELQASRFPRRYGELLRSLRFENAVEERMNSSRNAIDGIAEAEEAAQRVLSLVQEAVR